MSIFKLPPFGVLLIAASGVSLAAPKTQAPVKVDDSLLNQDPYRFNGVIISGDARGSGFCAWNKRAFFSAAHVVFDDDAGSWDEPPIWYPQAHADELDKKAGIQSRGYYRWADYSDIVELEGSTSKAFGKDVVLGFAFKDLIKGSPAKLNLNGFNDLKQPVTKLITGYPAENFYTGKPVNGYFMHQTGPSKKVFKDFYASAVQATLVATGRGNSGGPIWTKSPKDKWTAAGVMVGGLPSESIVYGFSNATSILLNAVAPVIKPGAPQSIPSGHLSATSLFFSSNRKVPLPDGLHAWTDVPLNVNGFLADDTVKEVNVSVRVKTAHRGDLQILLTAPGGYSAIIHNEEGAGTRNLVINFKDFTEDFLDIPPNGRWTLRFQDRLRGDLAVVQSVALEIVAESTGGGGEPEPEP